MTLFTRPVGVSGAMWRAGAVPAVAVGCVVVLAGLFSGAPGVAGAVLGVVLALAALSVPIWIMKATSSTPPPAVMALALLGYGVSVVVLGALWVLLQGRDWLSHDHLGAALIACTLAWTAGQVRGVSRLRVPAFGSPSDGGPDREDWQGDSPGH